MSPGKPWRAEFVTLFCVAQFICFFAGAVAIASLHKLGVAGFKGENDFGNILLGTLCFQGATWILIPIFLRLHGTNWREAFGFRDPKLKNSLLLAVAVIVLVAAPAVWWWQEISVSALKSLDWPIENQTAVTMIKGAKTWGKYAYLSFFAIVLAPVAEEFIFRGMLYSFVKQLGSPRWAFFGISAIFAEIHFDAGTLMPLFVLALVLTWLYEKTGNLLAPIVAHSLFNTANLVILHYANE